MRPICGWPASSWRIVGSDVAQAFLPVLVLFLDVFSQTNTGKNACATKIVYGGELDFTCNICGRANSGVEQLGREGASCAGCGSSMRHRSLMAVLAQEMFGAGAD